MIRKLFLATALVLAPFAAFAGSVKTDMLDPVVKINENCSAEGVNTPEGKRLLTAAHCAIDKEGAFFTEHRDDEGKIVSRTYYTFDVVRTDKNKDLGLLKVRDEKYEIVVVNLADKVIAQEGDQVWTVGYPLAFTRVITEGLLNQPLIFDVNGDKKEDIRLRASPSIDGGNSGGALFQKNGDKYEMIGLTSMKFNMNEHMGIYIPLKDIREFLRLDVGKATSHQIDQR